MREHALDDTVARRFLLGQLSDEEQGRIEELAFTDPKSFTFLQAVEADLIDEFLYGDLSPEEKEQFRKHFLSQPGRRQNLRVSKALQKYVTQDEVVTNIDVEKRPVREPRQWANWLWPESIAFRLSFAVIALILLAALGTWLVMRFRRQEERTPIQAHQEQPQQLPSPANSVSPSPSFATASPPLKLNEKRPLLDPARSIYSIVLAPGTTTRSDGSAGRRISLPLQYRKIEFKLSLIEKTSYSVFEATLESDGQTIQQWSDLHSRTLRFGRAILVQAPIELFEAKKNYRIRLSGVSPDRKLEHVNNYDFHIE